MAMNLEVIYLASLTYPMMKDAVYNMYKNSIWHEKVGRMSEKQIIGIYFDRICDKTKKLEYKEEVPMHTYGCNTCGIAFEDSDPDILWCPRCNSKKIFKEKL